MDDAYSQIRESPSLSESRHSCPHCQRIIIDPSIPYISTPRQTYATIIHSFEYSAAEITRAIVDKCVLFQGLASTKHMTEAKTKIFNNVLLDYQQSPTRTVIIDLRIQGSLSRDATRPPDVTTALFSGRWADEGIMPCKGLHFYHSGYHIDTDADDPAASYVSARPVYPYIFQDTMFQKINEWLKQCGTHIECVKAMEESICLGHGRGPARLLYVGSATSPSVTLVERGINMEYVALSYCWGGDGSMKLTKVGLDSWLKSIPFENLPRTIQDAIICTRCLGLKYIWVDRLCIIQDDAADITREIAAMPEVYQMAYLTFSASSAVTSHEGFLQSRDEASSQISQSRIALPYICPDGSKGSITLITHREFSLSRMPNTSPVDARAWTMQEQRLASRLVHFCSYHLLWTCHSTERVHQHSETLSSTAERAMLDQDRSFPVDPAEGHKNWESIVKDYTGRSLSYPEDKLVAISAVAQDTARRLSSQGSSEKKKPRYLAGLWEHHLPHALCWRRLCEDDDLRPRPSIYRAPSWSWAAVDGFIYEYPSKPREAQTIKIEILDCVVVPASDIAPFSAVSSAYLRIMGRMRQELWDRKEKSFVGECGERILPLTAWPDAVEDETELEIDSNEAVKVWCLEVGFNGPEGESEDEKRGPFGLLLVKAESMDNSVVGEALFRRVGNFYTFHEGDMSYEESEYRELTII